MPLLLLLPLMLLLPLLQLLMVRRPRPSLPPRPARLLLALAVLAGRLEQQAGLLVAAQAVVEGGLGARAVGVGDDGDG